MVDGMEPHMPEMPGPAFSEVVQRALRGAQGDGSRNLNWKPRREHPQDREQGRPTPYGGRPALLAP